MSTISTTKNFGIEFGISYQSPLTITSTGYINAGTSGFNGAAVYAAAAQSLALYNYGQIRATGAVQGVHEGSDQGLSITNSGTITAASDAVYLQSSGPITNSGTITSTGSQGITDTTGLQATNSGLISAAVNGIDAPTATISNTGTIKSTATLGGAAIMVTGSTGSVNNNGGLITGAYNGVQFDGGGSIGNSGTIYGANWGVRIEDAATITNSGTIKGAENGVHLFGSATVTNTGSILGADGAVFGAAASIHNSNYIGGTYGDGVDLAAGGYVSISSAGKISGGGTYTAIYVSGGAATVDNAGTISGDTGFAVGSGDSSNQTIIDSGTIAGQAGTAVLFSGGNDLLKFIPSASVKIQGTVDGGGGTNTLDFTSAASAGTLTGVGADFVNFSQGTVVSGASWVLAGTDTIGNTTTLTIAGTLVDSGTLTNAGSINEAAYTALQLQTGGYLLNGTTGVITLPVAESHFDPAVVGIGASTIVNLGTIKDTGGNADVYFKDGGTIVNGSAADTSAYLFGLQGIYAYGAAANVTNFGTIESNLGNGVALAQGGTVTNGAANSTAALISGGEYGIFDVNSTSNVITNFGTIRSTDFGISLGQGGTVVDAGTISGGTAAIAFNGNNNSLLVLEHGFALSGAITAGGAGNTVELIGTSSANAVSANYNALSLTGFGTVEFGPGAGNYATLTITNNSALPGTITNFTGAHDGIDLTALSDSGNDATTSFNTLTNVLTVTGDNGSVQLQLDAEDYTNVGWKVTPDGNGGSDVDPGSPPTVTEALFADTGASSTDKITSDPEVIGTADADATVTISEGVTTLGTATSNGSGVWSFLPTGLIDGSQTLVAKEVNNFGTGTASLIFTLDTVAPAVSIASAGTITNQATQTIAGTVSDANLPANATVTLFDNGTQIGTTTESGGSWSTSVTLPNQGTNAITAQATDLAGNTGTSAADTLTLDTTAPALTITSAGTITSQAAQTITGTVSDAYLAANATVTLFDNGTQIGTTTESGGSWSTSITLPNQGTNAITAQATDLVGNTGTSAADTLTFDTMAPAVTITSPGTITNQAAQTITGTVSDANLAANATVTLFDNGTQIGTTTESGGSWSMPINLSTQGVHDITAEATDLAGNTGTSAADAITYDITPPALTLDSLLSMPAGGISTIPGSLLESLDNLSSDAQETYTVTAPPQNGTLLVNGAAASTFTQAQIDAGLVTYAETAPGASSDAFGFTVADAAGNATGADSFAFSFAASQPGAQFGFFDPPGGMPVNLAYTTDGSNPPAPVPGDSNIEIITQPTQNSYALPSGYQGIATFPGGSGPGGSGSALDLIAGDVNVIDGGTGDSIAAGSGDSTVDGGQRDTITGGTGTDFINGTQGYESITGGSAGNETVLGGSGDTVNAGAAAVAIAGYRFDTLIGGTSADLIDGTAGDQMITGGSAGGDTIIGGAGDTINGGTGANDSVNAFAGDETIVAGSGNAIVYEGTGDVAEDGSGVAYFTFTGGSNVVALGLTAGAALAYAGANDTLTGGAETTTIIGAPGADFVLGAGTDTVNAVASDEALTFGTGSATVYGGPGDTIGDAAGTVVTFNGGSNAIILSGTGNSVVVFDGAGDTLTGGAGAATIIGAAGDNLTLGAGADTVNALPPNESVTFGTGNATVYGGDGDTIGTASGTDIVLTGGSSAIVVTAAGSAVTVTDGAGDTIAAGNAASMIIGAINSSIVMGAAGDTVTGANGDTVTAGAGSDSIDLGASHSAAEFLAPGSGTDTGANDTVVNFNEATGDRILETGRAETTALASAHTSGGNTTITLSDGSTVTLVGVNAINSNFFT